MVVCRRTSTPLRQTREMLGCQRVSEQKCPGKESVKFSDNNTSEALFYYFWFESILLYLPFHYFCDTTFCGPRSHRLAEETANWLKKLEYHQTVKYLSFSVHWFQRLLFFGHINTLRADNILRLQFSVTLPYPSTNRYY